MFISFTQVKQCIKFFFNYITYQMFELVTNCCMFFYIKIWLREHLHMGDQELSPNILCLFRSWR
jgi:hypothetical protein